MQTFAPTHVANSIRLKDNTQEISSNDVHLSSKHDSHQFKVGSRCYLQVVV